MNQMVRTGRLNDHAMAVGERRGSWLGVQNGEIAFARALVATLLLVSRLAVAGAGANLERFDGSFQLETGEVVTGGYMVEGGQGRWVYIDTQGLAKGGVFEPAGDQVFRSIGLLKEGVEIEFRANDAGLFDTVIWRESGEESVQGTRVFPHQSREVKFSSGDGTQLQGRLLLPDCDGTHPLVVSVHGSGPVNRYGGTFHTFFIKHGVAVLAYDKRGYTTDTEAWTEPDFAELSADAAAGIRFAASLPDIDSDRIGFFGSSQAGWVVPPAAIDAGETAFQILRVGAALTPAETILHEVRQEQRAKGLAGLDLDYAMQLRREIHALAAEGAPISETNALVAPYLDEAWYRESFGEGPISETWSRDWWKWTQRNNTAAPGPYLERFDGPVLWFLAERDENVPLVSTRVALERAFEAAPGNDHEIVVLEDAPHSFFVEDDDGNPRYADGFFDVMATWMNERGISQPDCWQ